MVNIFSGMVKIFQEKKSAAMGTRSQLEACLEYVRESDTLVVTRLDRLARSFHENGHPARTRQATPRSTI